MNLTEWREKRIFKEGAKDECWGELKVSFVARKNGESDPVISEQGRSFLAERLHRLSADHVRAIFKAARVDQLAHVADGDGRSGGRVDPVDEWVAVFQDKVRQIDARRCQPIP